MKAQREIERHPIEATLDPLIVAAKDDVDRTLFIETLAMTVDERLDSAYRFMVAISRFRPMRDASPEDR